MIGSSFDNIIRLTPILKIVCIKKTFIKILSNSASDREDYLRKDFLRQERELDLTSIDWRKNLENLVKTK
jgi:hypothetical protein